MWSDTHSRSRTNAQWKHAHRFQTHIWKQTKTQQAFCCKPWGTYRINERMNWPWLGLRAMLPEFKASSKRLNIVCNLEAEKKKKKGQSTANLKTWNEHMNTTQTHNAQVFSLTTSWQSKRARPRDAAHEKGGGAPCWDSKEAVKPFKLAATCG